MKNCRYAYHMNDLMVHTISKSFSRNVRTMRIVSEYLFTTLTIRIRLALSDNNHWWIGDLHFLNQEPRPICIVLWRNFLASQYLQWIWTIEQDRWRPNNPKHMNCISREIPSKVFEINYQGFLYWMYKLSLFVLLNRGWKWNIFLPLFSIPIINIRYSYLQYSYPYQSESESTDQT